MPELEARAGTAETMFSDNRYWLLRFVNYSRCHDVLCKDVNLHGIFAANRSQEDQVGRYEVRLPGGGFFTFFFEINEVSRLVSIDNTLQGDTRCGDAAAVGAYPRARHYR